MTVEDELLALNQQLLDAIATADWDTYTKLCDPSLTAYEPESRGHLVAGMGFHAFYFKMGASPQRVRTTMTGTDVRMMGDDAAVVSCVRLIQRQSGDGPVTVRFEETRVWQRQNGDWKHVHFHRSACE